MNWDVVQGKWKQIKGSVKEKWGELTDDELDQIDGDKEQLSGKLQEKYGWAKEDADKQIDDYFRDQG
ncbi:CsbD family protein [Paracoccus fistulariae]|uniref:CsbD family protein n=1 Tax=Paracoccus fistulariae TaxID=658446 RepID=A0ABY7SIY5_9RHOB|nr:CsbD family protein [Paracoccus fistulariae]MDB6180821.1 CsbD family protein [Paracoccus fistulariae]WCR06959.1 CsbD family protein [Paracoccus fistulariae]